MFHHILVPLDGTECAEQAIPLAAKIARASGATLTLLNVIEVVQDSPAYPIPVLSQEIIDAHKEKGISYLSRMRTSAYLNDLPVETKLWFGSFSGSLADARMEHIDLIVISRYRGTDSRHYTMGSIVQYIAHRGPIPVLLLHGRRAQTERNDLRPFCILVALDGSKYAETAIRPASMLSVLLSAPEAGSLYLLCMMCPALVPVNLDAEGRTQQTNDEARQMAQTYLEGIKKKMFREIVHNFPLRINFAQHEAQDVPEMLADLVEMEQTLIAPPLSAFASSINDRHAVARRLLGSVAETLFDCTHLPILAIQHAEERNEKHAYPDRVARQMSMR